MFSEKLASRADETPTFELSFSGLKLAGQKKVSKTQGFSMFFFCLAIFSEYFFGGGSGGASWRLKQNSVPRPGFDFCVFEDLAELDLFL